MLKIFILMVGLLMSGGALKGHFSKEELFKTPECISARISPDGRLIAEVGSDETGVANLFIREKGARGREQVSFFTSPEIIQFFWAPDSNKVLLLKDEAGSGQLHLHGFDIASRRHFLYTKDFPGASAKVVQISAKEDKAIIGLNQRNPRYHDLYELDLNSGALRLILQNDSYAKFLFSDDLKLILKVKIQKDGSWTLLNAQDEPLSELTAEEAFQTELLAYDSQEEGIYLLDARNSDFSRLIIKDLDGYDTVLSWDVLGDIEEVLFLEGRPAAFATYDTKKRWHIRSEEVATDLEFLESKLGSFSILNQSQSGDLWMVSSNLPDQGASLWLYERTSHKLTAVQHSQMEGAQMYELVVRSRDGLELVCYYTLPKEADRGGYVDEPLPLVVLPHGGPFKVRDRYEFNPKHQWLASCGYAVLSVNFRLSSGFGKAFVNAGNGEWGGKAHLDVIDAVEACIAKGIAARDRLAIFGGSYGGFETLAALTFTPDYFTCCIAVCGPSNLKTVLDNVPEYWEFTSEPLSDRTLFFTKRAFVTSMGGDPDEEEGIRYLQKCSPLNHLDRISAPLLLVHGKNDHIVAENESRQIFESMRAAGKEVTYILFPDEGHRFGKFGNRMFYLDQAEAFLSKHLGGKYQPIDEKTIASSAVIFKYPL